MFDKPITTIQQAKEFFKAMGCTHFHMDREFPARAKEYDSLKISRQTEKEWTQEQFDEYYINIVENADVNLLRVWHSNMEDLLAPLQSQANLMKMLEVTQFIRDKVPHEHRVIIAETIVGRAAIEARDGLIFGAFDLNQVDLAKKFCELALYFSNVQIDEMDESKIGNLYRNDEMILRAHKQKDFRSIYSNRCKRAIQKCNEIKKILRI